MCLVKIFVIFFRNITLIRLTLFYFIFFYWHLGTLSTVQCGVVKFTNFSLTLRYIVGFACFGRVTICFLVVLSVKLLKWHFTVNCHFQGSRRTTPDTAEDRVSDRRGYQQRYDGHKFDNRNRRGGDDRRRNHDDEETVLDSQDVSSADVGTFRSLAC